MIVTFIKNNSYNKLIAIIKVHKIICQLIPNQKIKMILLIYQAMMKKKMMKIIIIMKKT